MSTTYTTNYHLGKQEDTSDNFNMSVITANMDTIDTVLGNKADNSTTYTKTEVDTSLGNKADKSATYTKTEVDTALSGKVDKETGKGLSTNDYTTAEKTKLAGIAEGAEVNVQSNWTQTTTTADDYIKNKPTLGTAAAKNATDAYNATGTDVTTGKAVAAALATLPEPMVFKGSLGTGGTITSLPTASSSNKGYVYKVITAGTYASQSAKVGDTFISDGSAWVLIPSGDEPSGTVTNVAVANGGGLTISGSPITSSGTITVGHSNSVTAKTTQGFAQIAYDAQGHITSSTEATQTQLDAMNSGIDSTKVAQIATNETNISKDEAALVEIVDGGAKNLLDLTKATSMSVGAGITYTLADNGILTVNWEGLTTGKTLKFKGLPYISGTLILSGVQSLTNPTVFRTDVRQGETPETRTDIRTMDYGESPKEAFTMLNDVYDYVIRIDIPSGESSTSGTATLKPMICTKAAWDISQAYQPYRPSYQELYERVVVLEQENT